MNILPDGLIQQFLDILGIQITTATGHYVAFLATSSLAAVALISLMVLIFRFLVYLRRG